MTSCLCAPPWPAGPHALLVADAARLRTHRNVEPVTGMVARICTDALPNREVSGIEIVVLDAVIRVAPGFCPEALARAYTALRPC